MKKNHLLGILLIMGSMLLIVLVGCQSQPKSHITTAVIQQVYDGGTLQQEGTYQLENGALTITKRFQLGKNLNQAPQDVAATDEEATIAEKIINEEFPTEKFGEELVQQFQRVVQKASVTIDAQEKTTTLQGADGYQKKFQWIDGKQTRLKDEYGVEYSFKEE